MSGATQKALVFKNNWIKKHTALFFEKMQV
jgi:hypothetical protein